MKYPIIPRYANSIQVKTFTSGQRRTQQDPPSSLLKSAFENLGTHVAVAGAFGVDRNVIKRWLKKYNMEVTSRPELRHANSLKERLSRAEDHEPIAQWLMDEGSVSVAYYRRTDRTILLVCGSMNDYNVLSRISVMLGAPITSSKAPSLTTLPMGAVRVQAARAFALLEILFPRLVGLKAMEAAAALKFFPRSGLIKGGRHTNDEFLATVWRQYARKCLFEWNSRRQAKVGYAELEKWARTWVEGRIRRARRFVDADYERRSL